MAKLKRTMSCGCIVALDYDGTLAIFYCPKHKAAPEMYEALKNAVIAMASMYRLQEYTETEVIHELMPFKAALAKAEGGK